MNCITSRLSVFKLYNMCNKLFQCIEQINSLPDFILKSLNAKFCDGRYCLDGKSVMGAILDEKKR